MGIIEFLKTNRPLIGINRSHVKDLGKYLPHEDLKRIKQALNLGRVSFNQSSLGISKSLGRDVQFPTLAPRVPDKPTKKLVEELNDRIECSVTESKFPEFSKVAGDVIPSYVAFQLHGLSNVKRAITLQMFSKERVHILLLGDPGTGKTEFLQSVEQLYPKTTFGLGSGTSGAGLAVTVKGKAVMPGLLPSANKGICCIDELNLMKKEDYASLYSAMEKGFIAYDKGGSHYKFEADVRLLATANPIGDKFRGKTRNAIVRQLPLEPALLSRFTLVFLLRKPDLRTFMNIARDIVEKKQQTLNSADVEFIQSYIHYAEQLNVEFPKHFKDKVVEFSKAIKLKEDKLFFEVSPRLIHGLINLAKANARLELRNVVDRKDIYKARSLIIDSLENRVG